jgi:hypothetical protein
MRSGGKIPETIALISSRTASPLGGDAYHLTSYPAVQGYRARARPVYNADDREWAAAQDDASQAVAIVSNLPISGLKIADRVWGRGRYFYNVMDAQERVFTVEDHVVMDSAVHESIVGGVIGGTFIWADIPYMGMQLVRIGSVAHARIMESHNAKKSKSIPQKELVPGDILQSGSFATCIYLGQFATKMGKRVIGDAQSIALEDKKIRLFYHPNDWKLRMPRRALSSPEGYAEDLTQWMSVAGDRSCMSHRFGFDLTGLKRRVGRVNLSCHLARDLANIAIGNVLRNIRQIKANYGTRNPRYTKTQILRKLSEDSWAVHLTDPTKTPELNQLYLTAESML